MVIMINLIIMITITIIMIIMITMVNSIWHNKSIKSYLPFISSSHWDLNIQLILGETQLIILEVLG